MIKYHYAIDKDGNLVDIDKVTRDDRAKQYFCVGCGEELIPVLGDVREHHFRHKGNLCSKETYLHKLEKKILKEKFDSQAEFIIKYYIKYYCDKSKNCERSTLYKQQHCLRKELIVQDLKQMYDTCAEEAYYNGFRADLKIYSKSHPEREPIFIEISVTHDCEEKKKDSGIRIIEVKIDSEEDVSRPLIEEDSFFFRFESQNAYPPPLTLPVRFYNFPRLLEANCPNEEVVEDDSHQDAFSSDLYNVDNSSFQPGLYLMAKKVRDSIEAKRCDSCEHRKYCNQNVLFLCERYSPRKDLVEFAESYS